MIWKKYIKKYGIVFINEIIGSCSTARSEEQNHVPKQVSEVSDSINVLVDRLNELTPRKRIKVIDAFLTMLDYDTN